MSSYAINFAYHIEHAKATLTDEEDLPVRVRMLLEIIVSACEKGQKLETLVSDFAVSSHDARERVRELELENAALKRELAGEMEKY